MADEKIKKEHASFDMNHICYDRTSEIEKEFRFHVLPFWKNMRDEEFGGYFGWLSYDLNLDKKAVKGVILNDRIMWFFSNAYLTLHDDDSLKYAKHAYEFMINHALDKDYGGVYWSLFYDGRTDDTTKHTYNQAFAIYALSSYYEASNESDVINLAFELEHMIEEKCRDKNGYLEAFTRDFSPAENDKLSENGVVAGRTMNTHLHILEAYTALYRVGKIALERNTPGVTEEKVNEVRDRLIEILNIYISKIYSPDKRRQEVFFDINFNSMLDLTSFGHDIEASWLLEEASDIIGHTDITDKITAVAEEMRREVYENGFDGLSIAAEKENDLMLEIRDWWVQAEGIVGFLNGYERNPEKIEYLKTARAIWEFIKMHMIDRRTGSEWFSASYADGNPITQKAILEPWKCPYHTGRMCFEVIRRMAKIRKV